MAKGVTYTATFALNDKTVSSSVGADDRGT